MPEAWSALVGRLVLEWPQAQVVVELPLSRVDDPASVAGDVVTVTCGDEVYATTAISSGPRSVEAALRAHDPAALYVAAVLVPTEGEINFDQCPTVGLKRGCLSLGAVVVGAYDGEGFVYCSTTPPGRSG